MICRFRRWLRARVVLSADTSGVAVGLLGRPILDFSVWFDFKLRVFELRVILGGVA
jgi:hypothetical protein